MNRLFECLDSGFFKVSDGTLVNPFLNPKDIMSGLPWDILDALGIAAGYIFETGESTDAPPIYDDAIVVGSDWRRLAKHNWNPPELGDPARSYEARQRAIQRLAAKTRASGTV